MKSYFVLDNGDYYELHQYAVLVIDAKDCNRVRELAEEHKILHKKHDKKMEKMYADYKQSLKPGTVGWYLPPEIPHCIEVEKKKWAKPENVFLATLRKNGIKAQLFPFHELTITEE